MLFWRSHNPSLWFTINKCKFSTRQLVQSIFLHHKMNNQNDSEEEYVPPGKRLITPPDVVEIDPNMTVFWSIHGSNDLGTIPRWNTGLQSDSNRRNSSSHQSHRISCYFDWHEELGAPFKPNPQNAEHGYARQSRSVGVIRQQNPRD